MFPAPAAGQARAGEALPAAPRVTSATGHISTRPCSLAREGWAEGVLLPLRCLAGNPASGERKGLREGGGADGKGEHRGGPSLRPFGQMLTRLRAPGPRGAQELLPPPASCRIHRDGGAGAEGGTAERNGKGLPATAPCAGTGWGTAPRPLGAVGGVLSAGSSSQQMETRPWKLLADGL